MKQLRQFSTIFALIVIGSGCQLIDQQRLRGNVDGDLTLSSSITSGALQPTDLSAADLSLNEDVVLAAALAESDLDLDYAATTLNAAANAAAPAARADADLWARLRKGFMLEHHLDEARVQSELQWYASHPEYLNRVAARASRYLYHIVEAIEQRQMPMELALLPIVESAFDPFAYSHGRASGLWQFIPATARSFDMQVDYWHDGRRDVRRATNGALNYLQRLHDRLDADWLLALKGYNTGEGTVRYSMRKNTKAGKPLDFFSLGLLKETRAYVPRLLAISAIIADPAKYNVELLSIADEPYWEMVDIGSQLDLAIAAEAAEISMEELYLLNPAYNKWSTHPDGPHELLVPVKQAQILRTNLATLPMHRRMAWQRHLVKSGESLSVIAAEYNTSAATLRQANKLRGNLIRIGQSLMIPVSVNASEAYELSAAGRLKARQDYTEKKIGVTPEHYVVKSGDSFWDISRAYKVPMASLAKWNGMAPTDPLMPGQQLLIFSGAEQDSAPSPSAWSTVGLPSSQEVIRKVNYRVREGESLALIANKFNLSVASIKQWNQSLGRKKYIQPGDHVTLYVDVTQTE